MRESGWTEAVDRIGIFVSAACLLHCLATPIVLSLLAVYAHFLPSEERTHRILALFITILGVTALLTGYRRHKRPSVLVLMTAGLLFILAGAFFGDRLPSHWDEVAITLAGSSCLIAAHRINHTFCRSCAECCHDSEEQPGFRTHRPPSRG
jgi:peptidoglycan/LPS O-acetylase OafA/YrhL